MKSILPVTNLRPGPLKGLREQAIGRIHFKGGGGADYQWHVAVIVSYGEVECHRACHSPFFQEVGYHGFRGGEVQPGMAVGEKSDNYTLCLVHHLLPISASITCVAGGSAIRPHLLKEE